MVVQRSAAATQDVRAVVVNAPGLDQPIVFARQAEELAATAQELRRLAPRFTMTQPATNVVSLRKAA